MDLGRQGHRHEVWVRGLGKLVLRVGSIVIRDSIAGRWGHHQESRVEKHGLRVL